MGIFAHKSISGLGIDLGTSSLKAVEIALVDGKPRLVNYGYVENIENPMRAREMEAKKRIAYLLRKMLDEAGIASRHTATALPNFSVFSAVMSVPYLKKNNEFDAAIRWEAKKFVPMPLEEMTLKWEILQSTPHGKTASAPSVKLGAHPTPASHQQVEVLITAAPRSVLQHFVDIFQFSQLELTAIETESLASARCLVGNDPATVVLVDIGAVSSDISVIEHGVPVISRSIDTGGISITKVIQQHMNIDERRAEQFKRDIGMGSGVHQEQEGMRRLIDSVFQPVLNEIRYSLELYQHRGKGVVQKVVLSGGSAYLIGIVEYLSEVLKLPVFIGDVWQFVSYPQDLKPVLDELGPRFSVSAGLALRNLV